MKHHYVPQFLLRRWTNAAGKLHVFTIRNCRLVSKERAPEYTGYENGLYAVVINALGLDEDVIERKVFKPLDNNAAKVLEKLEQHEAVTEDEHIAWTFFLSSLRVRQPDALDFLRTDGMAIVKQLLAARDAETLPPGSQSSEQWFARHSPGSLEAATVARLLPRMIAHQGVTDAFGKLKWWFREFAPAEPKLLLSDMPLQWEGGFTGDGFFILLPIAPNRLFIGTRSADTEQTLSQMPSGELVRRMNLMSLGTSSQRIWASTEDGAREFIAENLDTWGVDVHTFKAVAAEAGITSGNAA